VKEWHVKFVSFIRIINEYNVLVGLSNLD
jgi:hypothetical protein